MADQVPVSILLVEDEEAVLKLLDRILARKFPEVVLYMALNGRAGLELFEAHNPDIVITDIKMPEMGGVQMTDKIRAIKPDTKFIILTGDPGKSDYYDSGEKGFEFDHYIMKPVIFGVLFAAIEQCLAGLCDSLQNSQSESETVAADSPES